EVEHVLADRLRDLRWRALDRGADELLVRLPLRLAEVLDGGLGELAAPGRGGEQAGDPARGLLVEPLPRAGRCFRAELQLQHVRASFRAFDTGELLVWPIAVLALRLGEDVVADVVERRELRQRQPRA